MRISVVIIVFNLEAYVGQAIESVLSQTRPADEIIVVDDCSSDGSADRIKAYGDRARYLKMTENSGALLAALRGVKAATGDIVCMLDGDDFWASNKLEIAEREFLADPDLVLLSHDHVRVNETGSELSIRDETHRNIARILRRAQSPQQLSDLLRETVLDQRGYWLGSAYSFRRCFFDILKFEFQIEPFGFERLRQTYLDLVIAPFLVLTNPNRHVGYTARTRFSYRVHDQGSLGGNLTPEKALSSARKGRTINELIELVMRSNGASASQLQRRALILEEYDYLAALYAGRFAEASKHYMRLARGRWSLRQLAKETKRLIAVRFLGMQSFLDLKAGR